MIYLPFTVPEPDIQNYKKIQEIRIYINYSSISNGIIYNIITFLNYIPKFPALFYKIFRRDEIPMRK